MPSKSYDFSLQTNISEKMKDFVSRLIKGVEQARNLQTIFI